MKNLKITKEIKQQIEEAVMQFNSVEFDSIGKSYYYFATYRGKFIYLNIQNEETVYKAGRLSYTGDLNDMEFAIYKFSRENYDSDEFMFPGVQYLDGTVNGALQTCNTAYPPM